MFKKEDQTPNKMLYRVDEENILKGVLLNRLNFSVRSISKIKIQRSILVNGKFQKMDYILKPGDIIEVFINEEKSNFEPQDLNLDVLYEDFDLIVVDKPPFIVVHPTKSHYNNTIANGVSYYFGKRKEEVKIRFVNRIDMNTSGLVIVAKNAYAHHVLSDNMKYDKVEKKYIAVVEGNIKDDEGTIEEPIFRPTEDSIKRIVDKKGQYALSKYKVLERLNGGTIVEVRIFTGRTHQIRVHMSHIGHGIIGDELYGKLDESLIKRQALHAYSLKFKQPRTKEVIEIKSDIPIDMKELIDKLK